MEMTSMKVFDLAMPLAQDVQDMTVSPMQLLGAHLIAAVVFSLVGVVVLGLCLLLMEKLTPFSIVHEIGEEHNQALATIVAALVLGVSIIIAAAILG